MLTILGDSRTVDTLLFGQITDDCHGSIFFKVIVIVVNFLLAGVIVAGTIGILWAGVQILTARDNATKIASGKKRILDVLIGISSYVFMFIALNFIIPGGITLDVVTDPGKTCPNTPSLSENPGDDDPEDPENPEDPSDPTDEDHGTRKFVMCGMTFDVIKIQVNGVKDDGTDSTGLKKFLTDKVMKYHINQSDDRVYDLNGNYTNSSSQDGHCDAVSRNLAYDMYFDTLTSDSCSAGGRDPRKSGFSSVTGDKKFQQAYADIMAGKPVVHRVTINKNGTNAQPHYAVLVGVKENAVKTNLQPADFLFVETWGNGILWNNIPGVAGGYRTNAGGSGCQKVAEWNRFPYETYYYVPNKKVDSDTKDCGN